MYCSKCGRELKDGEVCNCTTNVEKPTIKFSDTVMSTVLITVTLNLIVCFSPLVVQFILQGIYL